MNKLSVAQKAYIAGFLDGDGSIYVQLKKNKTYRFRYQVAPYIVFFQAKKERMGLENLQRLTGVGYLRDRNDGIVEYIIGDVISLLAFLAQITPYVYLKKRQAVLMLEIIKFKRVVRSGADFLKLCLLIDQFQKLNYSKRRINIEAAVREVLQAEGLLTP